MSIYEICEINESIDSVVRDVNKFLKNLDGYGLPGKDNLYYSKVLLHHIIPIFTSYFDECRRSE